MVSRREENKTNPISGWGMAQHNLLNRRGQCLHRIQNSCCSGFVLSWLNALIVSWAVRMCDATEGRYMGMLWETSWGLRLGGDNCSCNSVGVCFLFHLLVSLMHQVYIKTFCIRHQLLPEFFFHQLPEYFPHKTFHKATFKTCGRRRFAFFLDATMPALRAVKKKYIVWLQSG